MSLGGDWVCNKQLNLLRILPLEMYLCKKVCNKHLTSSVYYFRINMRTQDLVCENANAVSYVVAME